MQVQISPKKLDPSTDGQDMMPATPASNTQQECKRCTSTDRHYQLRLMEAKSQAPIQHMKALEEQNQKWQQRWDGLGVRIEDALEDISGYRQLNHDLIFATDRNIELRDQNITMANTFKDYKLKMENVIGRMQHKLEELHLKAGRSRFSAGFQSRLETDDMRRVGRFIDPNMSSDKSSSIMISSTKKTNIQMDQMVVRAF